LQTRQKGKQRSGGIIKKGDNGTKGKKNKGLPQRGYTKGKSQKGKNNVLWVQVAGANHKGEEVFEDVGGLVKGE